MSTLYAIIALVFSSAFVFGIVAWGEYAENPKHNFWISKKIKKHELQLAQKELEKELAKNPPPVQPVRRSRRKGWSAAASERWWKEVYDTGVLRKPFYRPKRRKHRSAYKIFW